MRRNHASRPLPGHSGGFTLLEMLVVLAMTGLIAGLLYPQLQTATNAIQQRHAREQVAAGAEGARALAIRSGQPAMLSAMDGGNGLVIAAQTVVWRQLPLGNTGALRLSVRPQSIVFYPDGSTSGGQLQLASATGPTLDILATYVIDRGAGRLRETGVGGA